MIYLDRAAIHITLTCVRLKKVRRILKFEIQINVAYFFSKCYERKGTRMCGQKSVLLYVWKTVVWIIRYCIFSGFDNFRTSNFKIGTQRILTVLTIPTYNVVWDLIRSIGLQDFRALLLLYIGSCVHVVKKVCLTLKSTQYELSYSSLLLIWAHFLAKIWRLHFGSN